MESSYISTKDGAQIAYSVCGKGDALLLLHGSGRTKEVWEKFGWVEALQTKFTVIMMDIRGFGKSSRFHDAKAYAIDNILDDIMEVVSACGFKEFAVFGHSYGATITIQALGKKLPITKAVLAGGSFGTKFFREDVPVWKQEYALMNEHKKRQEFSAYNEEEANWLKETDIDSYLAMFDSWMGWEGVEVDQISVPVALYSGTMDSPACIDYIVTHSDYLKKAGIPYYIFEGVNHAGLIEDRESCGGWVTKFLLQ